MPKRQNTKPNSYSEILFTSFIEDLNNSPDMVSETLKENHIDENLVAKKGNEIAGKLIAKMRIKTAKESKQNFLQKALSLLSDSGISLAELDPREKLFALLSPLQSKTSFTFSNLKDFSNQDILEMLSEIQVMDLIEELEKNKDQDQDI